MGGPRGSCPKKYQEKKLRLQLNNFTQKLDFDVLEERTKIWKKKKRKRKKKPHRGQKWVGWDKSVC